MPVESLRAVLAAAGEIPAAVRETWDAVSDSIEGGTATTADLQHLAADIDGHLEDISEIRSDLDAVDAVDYVRGTHPDQLVLVWQAERETRRQLVRMAAALRDLQTSIEEIAGGATHQVYVAREGDTLQGIAAQRLGDWRAYTDILAANPSLAPGLVPTGTLVVIPERR